MATSPQNDPTSGETAESSSGLGGAPIGQGVVSSAQPVTVASACSPTRSRSPLTVPGIPPSPPLSHSRDPSPQPDETTPLSHPRDPSPQRFPPDETTPEKSEHDAEIERVQRQLNFSVVTSASTHPPPRASPLDEGNTIPDLKPSDQPASVPQGNETYDDPPREPKGAVGQSTKPEDTTDKDLLKIEASGRYGQPERSNAGQQSPKVDLGLSSEEPSLEVTVDDMHPVACTNTDEPNTKSKYPKTSTLVLPMRKPFPLELLKASPRSELVCKITAASQSAQEPDEKSEVVTGMLPIKF